MVHRFVVESFAKSTIIPKGRVRNTLWYTQIVYTMNYDWKCITFTNKYEYKFSATIHSLTKNIR